MTTQKEARLRRRPNLLKYKAETGRTACGRRRFRQAYPTSHPISATRLPIYFARQWCSSPRSVSPHRSAASGKRTVVFLLIRFRLRSVTYSFGLSLCPCFGQRATGQAKSNTFHLVR